MSLLDAVRRANRPGPPEHSVVLRVACGGAVMVGIAACRAQGELSWAMAALTAVLVVAGMTLSYATRRRPLPWMKPILAGAAVVAFVWFFRQLTDQTLYDVSTVEVPLAVLFVWVQVAHAFDVPARRDLAFSLAGSASLMAVAAAQATDMGFGLYAVCWIGFGLVALFAMWSSASDGGRIRAAGVAGTVAAVATVGTAVLVTLPAPHAASRIDFPSAAGPGAPVPTPGGLVGDGKVTEPARSGSPAGPARVGGYLGFANRLDTALRGHLGATVVMRVRAQRPSYWVGETFDQWNGADWNAGNGAGAEQELSSGSPFVVPGTTAFSAGSQSDLQTFYVVQSSPNLVFHADDARQVWFPTHQLFVSSTDAIVSPIALGPGAIYTVESDVATPSPGALRSAPGPAADPAAVRQHDLQLPVAYPRVAALASAVTAHDHDTYDKVRSLMAWIGAHTHYSTDIPPLRPGQDTVDEFLFGNRTGFCEQISTALAVMLRSLGIPAREAVGYVPGPYNPITDLYEVQAQDAHAWVQVWFPGYGWQSFDPTAVVPAANPSPGSALAHDVAHALARVPWAAVLGALAVAGALALDRRRRRRRPRTWGEQVARRIEAAGRRAGRPRQVGETLSEYAAVLDERSADPSGTWRALAQVVEASAYGGRHPPPEERRRLLAAVRALRPGPPPRRHRPPAAAPTAAGSGEGAVLTPAAAPAPRRSSPPPPEAAGTP